MAVAQEIRDSDQAQQYVLQGLLCARVVQVTSSNISSMLHWCLRIAADGLPMPPAGFVADVFQLASNHLPTRLELDIPGFAATKLRRYEDYVLGKLDADSSFERGSEAIARYKDDDRTRALVFLLNQIRSRAKLPSVIVNPAVIKTLIQTEEQDVFDRAWESVETDGISQPLLDAYEETTEAIRLLGDALGREDIFELERGTALDEFSQRVAIRQMISASAELDRELPGQKPRSTVTHHSVATNIAEEDYYPVGGYSSLSNRGTMESLLRSELMYIDREQRPDLFDIKYARDELLYYSRDENQFFRQRQTFIFALSPDLVTARFKDPELPWQRIVLVLGGIVALQQKLLDWLGDQSLSFEILFCTNRRYGRMEDEFALLDRVFFEEIESDIVRLNWLHQSELATFCDAKAKESLAHCLWFAADSQEQLEPPEFTSFSEVVVDNATPQLAIDQELRQIDNDGLPAWQEMLEVLLRFWV